MKKKEMTKIFGVMMLAFPNAEMFKGGIEQLKPTIELWTACLPDIDFWTGQQALVRLCRECKYPPTIAEFKAQADNVRKELKNTVNGYIQQIRMADAIGESLEGFYASLPVDSHLRMTIDLMGGVSKLVITHHHNGKPFSMWNWSGLEESYKRLMRSGNALTQEAPQALPAARKDSE